MEIGINIHIRQALAIFPEHMPFSGFEVQSLEENYLSGETRR
jgi:hypothetical protein